MSRRIFIGDIQGCREPLERLLAACQYQPGDKLHPVGDMVNKGPDSVGVVVLLRDLGAEPVLGNHDREWLAAGRTSDPVLRAWLAAQPIVRIFADLILVHGGLHPKWHERDLPNLDAAGVEYATNVRYCDADGNRPARDWPPPPPPYEPWDHFYRGSKRVVFGHWARRGLVKAGKVIGLDTGCVYGNELSAYIPEEDRVVQVPGWRR